MPISVFASLRWARTCSNPTAARDAEKRCSSSRRPCEKILVSTDLARASADSAAATLNAVDDEDGDIALRESSFHFFGKEQQGTPTQPTVGFRVSATPRFD